MTIGARSKWLITGVLVYLLFLVITIPASALTNRLAQRGIQTTSSAGSIWHGQVTGLRAGVLNLGNVEWRVRFLPLFTGKLAADFDLKQEAGYAQGRASVSITGKLQFTTLSASLPLQSLLGSGGLPGGWTGTAQARFDELVFDQQWPVAASGTLDIIDLTGPASSPSNIGAYRLSFPATDSGEDALTGALTDMDGAVLDVVGQLKFAADRNYQLDTRIATSAAAPATLVQSLQMLGAPDAEGRRPFSLSGSF